ncbi:hypothetical protein TELCIR_14299 [Teladorsagia circumcincta]|uniref:NADP-dependent oxidoreductase domain-containing protein n=1 Tax=Teladorsagia circumcincta TaxID=45464 RepID=A0A2G9U305_TELCI|nr:hypothetical protein TELCIR_14299 [Teladorsagia circumcincta]
MDRDMAIIPKSVKPARVVENFQLFDFKLSKDEIKLLESTKNRQRLFTDDLVTHRAASMRQNLSRRSESPIYNIDLNVVVRYMNTLFSSMIGHPEDPFKSERK